MKLKRLEANVRISSPPADSKPLGTSFQITGSASARALVEIVPGEPDVEDATRDITGVSVRVVATGQVQSATATGSGPEQWATWSFAADTTLRGPQVITAFVGGTREGLSASGTSDSSVDIEPPPPGLNIAPFST